MLSKHILKNYSKTTYSFITNTTTNLPNTKVGLLTIDNSTTRNSLSEQVINELHSRILDIKEENEHSNGEKSSVIILNTVGPVFSSGHDLKELSELNNVKLQEKLFEKCANLMQSIQASPSLYIAEVQGLATAAGLQLACSCDLVVASSKASFALPGNKIGLFPLTPAVAVYESIHNKKILLDMLLTGDELNAEQALNYGLINRIVEIKDENNNNNNNNKSLAFEDQRKQLREYTVNYAEKIASYSSQIRLFGKSNYYKMLSLNSVESKYEFSTPLIAENLNFKDCKEGVIAFLERTNKSNKKKGDQKDVKF